MADENLKIAGRPQNRSTAAVRAYAATTGRFTRAAVRSALGLSEQSASTAIDTLLRGGRIQWVARATYEWVPEKKPNREAPLEDRIWHAMRINQTFTSADIALQAGTTVSYVYKRLRLYRSEGFVKQRGVKRVNGASCKLWRLTSDASQKIEVPVVKDYSPDPAAVAAVRLNRLVCTGLVRFEDERKQAVSLCKELLAILENAP
jgi:molybdopterin converting factor small subunit